MKKIIINHIRLFFILYFTIFFSPNCTDRPSSPVIACVGKATFTVDDLLKCIPAEYREQITLEQNINYVKQWIDTELLFQEALRRKIDKEPVIRDRLQKMKKDLLSAEIINRNSSIVQTSSYDEKSVKTFYEINKEKFIREKDVAKYLEIVVTDLRTAWYISKNASQDNFLTFAAEYSQQPYPEDTNIPYITLDEVQPEIRQAILSTPINSSSNPVKSDVGYHVIYVLDKLEKGGICKEEEIWEEIINQLSSKSQKESIEQLLADLRLKTNVEFHSELLKQVNLSSDSISR